jgi:peptide/nickel transport system permease protein
MRPQPTSTEPVAAAPAVHIDAPLEPPRTPKQIARARRKAAAKRVWKEYRKNRMGMAGLIILGFFVFVAIFAPLLASACGLDPTCPSTGPQLQAPTLKYPLGTDDLGRSVLTLTIWGPASR